MSSDGPGCAGMVITAVLVVILLVVLAIIGPPDSFTHRY